MPHSFGAKLRAFRELLHLSQTAFAQMLGISQSSLSDLETSRRPPSLALAARIASSLGVRADYLLRDELAVEPNMRATKVHAVRERESTYVFDTLGDRIQRLRLTAGLSQASLAHSLGLASHSHISYLESGRKVPSIELLIRIADHFGVAIDDLVRGTTLAAPPDEQPEQ